MPSRTFQQVLSLIDPPAEHRFLTANGIRTAYLEAGEGPLLVLLHGAGGGAANWYKVIGPLSKHFRVIAFDKPGYGESDKPWANYSKAFYVDWLQAAVEALGIGRFHLLGNSQGGAVAIAYALEFPQRLHKLVLVSPGGMSDEWDRSIIPQMILYRLFPSPIWDRLMGSKVFKDSTVAHPAWHRYTTEVIRKRGGRYPFFLGRGKAVQTFTDDELRSVRPATLVIWGEDEAFFPVAHGERAAALIPDAKLLLLPGAGHFPWMEEPERFVEAVVGFCDSPGGSGPC
ncbi:MAG: alpha/beta fold hydrolase [Bacteroidetes bacterium]|jgi:4,5:9,10-diseco-3-hydroxy-5,9,17-trioxoandrosta-1(10),2-diene-4-oate hydrolase|nr:alpha/beta fold hydrolase [Bacteroidota bacterium]